MVDLHGVVVGIGHGDLDVMGADFGAVHPQGNGGFGKAFHQAFPGVGEGQAVALINGLAVYRKDRLGRQDLDGRIVFQLHVGIVVVPGIRRHVTDLGGGFAHFGDMVGVQPLHVGAESNFAQLRAEDERLFVRPYDGCRLCLSDSHRPLHGFFRQDVVCAVFAFQTQLHIGFILTGIGRKQFCTDNRNAHLVAFRRIAQHKPIHRHSRRAVIDLFFEHDLLNGHFAGQDPVGHIHISGHVGMAGFDANLGRAGVHAIFAFDGHKAHQFAVHRNFEGYIIVVNHNLQHAGGIYRIAGIHGVFEGLFCKRISSHVHGRHPSIGGQFVFTGRHITLCAFFIQHECHGIIADIHSLFYFIAVCILHHAGEVIFFHRRMIH